MTKEAPGRTPVRVLRRSPGFRIDSGALLQACRVFFRESRALALRRGLPPPDGGVDVLLLSPAASAAAHQAANGAEGATDAITLPYAATPFGPARGEILVCPAVARAAAADRTRLELLPEERDMPWSADLELALYVAHGFDHLAGSDDSTAAGYRAMRHRELKWLAKAFPDPARVSIFA